ncbi:hypothetical protein [Streptomyces sp. NRRL B-1347]|uniref:hypothetical protein n=1 Tax=Streptomyces sp. NRRL B-1347 TaxID=1476877 RepID=UPI00131E946D|nr:hypothetical protein [Streptomyces sp. NRRL B-1347]
MTCSTAVAAAGAERPTSNPPKPVPRAAPGTSGLPLPKGPVPGGFATWAELFGMQQRLNSKAMKIEKAARTQRQDNPVGIVAAPENRELRVYWHGTVPDSMRRQLSSRAGDVPVKVLPARFRTSALRTAVRKLKASGATTMAVPQPDGSGVAVRWSPGTRRHTRAVDGIPVALARGASPHGSKDVPLTGRCADGAGYCREDDIPPYYAGARTSNCTVGWPLRLANDAPALLTAGHCGASGVLAYDGGGDLMGGYGNHSIGADHATIGAAGSGRMWDGSWQNSTFTKPIDGWTSTFAGNHICTSGSRSGALCGIQVSYVDSPFPPGSPGAFAYAAESTARYGPGQGDSGGPVFSLTGDGSRVVAQGTVTSGATDARVPCRGENWEGRVCSWFFRFDRIDYAFGNVLSPFFGARIVTS